MNKISHIPARAGKKRIVIIGGGFGGLKLAMKLNPKHFQVVILDKNNYHQFQPLLYQVAIAGLEATSIAYPFRKNFQHKSNIHFRMCEVSRIIPEEKLVETPCGSIDYDELVIAAGCDTNFFGNDALRESTITLKSVSEALQARNHILQCFEQASITRDPKEVEKLLTFVIVGGGATGVEMAGALADMKNFVLGKDYPELNLSRMKIHLIDASPRLLSAMSEQASAEAAKTLKKRGVIIHQDASVLSYEHGLIKASDGAELLTYNVIWVAGIKANRIQGLKDTVYGRGGRLLTDPFCRVKGQDDIYAIGDIAYMETEDSPHGHPQVAQVAIQMAEFLSVYLERNLDGQTPVSIQVHPSEGPPSAPFHYKDKGSLATIGRNAAVADMHKLRFGGKLAWWLWLLIHIYAIVGIKNKIVIFLDWAWNYVSYDVSLRLLIRQKDE